MLTCSHTHTCAQHRYHYDKKWSTSEVDSRRFESHYHNNPTSPFSSNSYWPASDVSSNAKIGSVRIKREILTNGLSASFKLAFPVRSELNDFKKSRAHDLGFYYTHHDGWFLSEYGGGQWEKGCTAGSVRSRFYIASPFTYVNCKFIFPGQLEKDILLVYIL